MSSQRRSSLENRIDELNADIIRLKLENSVYQKYHDKKKAELGPDEEEKKKGRNKKKSVPTTLTLEQKNEIANIVHEDLQAETEMTRKNSEKMVDTLRAVLEETEIRIGELKRDAYEFKRDVVVGAENARTGKIVAERVTRYFEDKIHGKDAIIEKLRLKNAALKSQICKIEAQLSQKEEIGDVLHYIDFHQLQIENKQYVAKIEDRNDELLTVKLSTGKTLQALNELKRVLNEKMAESEWLRQQVEEKQAQKAKLMTENKRVGKDVKTEKRARNRLRQQIEEAAEMPLVEDYINQKREMYALEAGLKNWHKKLEILEMAAKRSRAMTKK
jgi:hypothetical protein